MASEDGARADGSAGDLLGPAWSLRWRAPEVALLLAERAGAVAQLTGDGPDRLRAEATAVVASCRLGQRLDVVERAVAALRLAERQSESGAASILRVELAGCARAAGVPLVGAAVLRSVLTADGVRPSVRADALVELASCLAQLVDPGVLDGGLAEADRLYAEAGEVDADTRVVRRALLRSVASGELRRRGDVRAAVEAAQEGVDLLGSLNRAFADNGAASARVTLHLVHGLIDLGRVDDAGVVAAAELAKPVRAPAATAIGWLALAIAVRQHLANGAPVPALALLREAAQLAERHRLAALRAEVLTTLSDAHERVGQLADALDCLRTAQGVRLRRTRAVYGARTKLVSAFGETSGPEEFVQLLAGSGRTGGGGRRAAGRSPGRENAAALLGRFGMRHPIGTTVTAAPTTDVTMVLVDVTHGDPTESRVGEQVVSQVLDHVRAAAPTRAQVARVGGAELAVLLPAAAAGQAEHWVERLRDAIADVDWAAVAPGVAVNVRVAVAQPSSVRAAEPVPTAAAQPGSAAQPVPASGAGPAAIEPATAPQPVPDSGPAQRTPGAEPHQPVPAAPGHATWPAFAASSSPTAQPVSLAEPGLAGRSVSAAEAGSAAWSVSGAQAGWTDQPVAKGGSVAGSPGTAPPPAAPAASPAPASTSMFELPTVPIMPVDIGADIQTPSPPTTSPPEPAAPSTAEPVREPRQPAHQALPALPIPPPLEPEPPVFQATTPSQDAAGDVPMSSDPSVRISAADMSSVGAEPGESRPRHAVDTGTGSSVLSSLGITAGSTSGGGRRRAREADEPATLFGASPGEPSAAAGLTDLGPAFRPRPPERRADENVPPADRNVPAADRNVAPADIPAQPDPAPLPPRHSDEPQRTGGKRRRSVQLADLLTEALMAYQSAQDSNDAKNNPLDPSASLADPSASLPGPTALPGPLARPVDRLDAAVGDEQPGHPARHRGDPRSGDPAWLSARWKRSDERP